MEDVGFRASGLGSRFPGSGLGFRISISDIGYPRNGISDFQLPI